jgi:small GTP-binding protein
MQKDLIKGIIYSQFDEKAGPIAKIWIPDELSLKIRNLISLKSINILAGETGAIPVSLAIIPFPSLNLKGVVKYMEIPDMTKRGKVVDSSLTLLFDEADDPIFYKYVKSFESVFKETATNLVREEVQKQDRNVILAELTRFQTNMVQILEEFREREVSVQPTTEFPETTVEDSKLRGFRYKIIVVGDPSVGKTSTVLRFTDNAFKRSYIPTIGVNISEKIVNYKDAQIKFVLWDIAGQSKFQRMRSYFYKGADGQLLVFDLTNPESFNSVSKWKADITNCLALDLPGLILGNKNDLIDPRKITIDQIKNLAEELHLGYFETSALTGENVHEAFLKFAAILYEQSRIKAAAGASVKKPIEVKPKKKAAVKKLSSGEKRPRKQASTKKISAEQSKKGT